MSPAASRVAVEQWPPRGVTDLRRRLSELKELVASSQHDTPQETGDWLARLLVVRSCGYLEQMVMYSVRGYLAGRSAGPVRAFGQSWLERGRNPTPEWLTELVGRFDAQWSADLVEFLEADDQRLRREVAFLVDRRNKIAHGLNEGIRIRRALELHASATEVADWFLARFNPER